MNWKRLAAIGAAALLASYAGARLAGPDPGTIALAAGGSGVEPAKGLVAVTTGAPGQETNRLILVDTVTKRLAVYKIGNRSLRLIALRSYNYDMKIDDTAELAGKDFSYEQIRDFVLKSDLPANQKTALPPGRELVLTTDGDSNLDANRIVLINPEEKRIAIYRLNGNQLLLVAARRYDYDLIPEFIRGAVPGEGYDRRFMKDDKDRRDNPPRE